MRSYFIYIITNKEDRVLYIGVTNDLEKRIYQHKNKLIDGFSKRYNLGKLVYYEVTQNVESALLREKELKGWLRKKKIELINTFNPEWKDLSEDYAL